jgi:hypothetical protein
MFMHLGNGSKQLRQGRNKSHYSLLEGGVIIEEKKGMF